MTFQPQPTGGIQKGMSFLEVMAVVLIVGIMAGVSLPNFTRFATEPLELEGIRLSNYIRDLQFKSILTGKDIRLKIDPEKEEYEVLGYNEETAEWERHESFQDPIPFTDGVSIDSVKIGSNQTEKSVVHINIKTVGYVDIFSIIFKSGRSNLEFNTLGVLGKISISEIY